MSEQLVPSGDSPARSVLHRIDEVCDRFEDVWKTGQRPRIEEFLADVPEPERPLLLRELLLLELEYRYQGGETLVLEDYAGRFPEYADFVCVIITKQQAGEHSQETASFECQASTGPQGKRQKEMDQPERLGRYRVTGKLGEGGF